MKCITYLVAGTLGVWGCGSAGSVDETTPVQPSVVSASGGEVPAPRICPHPGDGRDPVLGAATPENERADAALRQAHEATTAEGIDQALTSLRADAGVGSTHPWTAYAEAWMLVRMERFDEAAEALGRAIAAHPHFDRAHLDMGALHVRAGRQAEAVTSYQHAIEANPGMMLAWYNLGQVHYLLGDYEDALFEWGCALAIDPSDFRTQTKVVQSLHALDRFEEAADARSQIRARWDAGEIPRETSGMVIDQFMVGSHRVYVEETFHLPADELHYIYTFSISENDRVLRTVQLETSPALPMGGADSLMGTSTNGTHAQLGVVFRERPSYEELRPIARGLIEDIQAGRAQTSISSTSSP